VTYSKKGKEKTVREQQQKRKNRPQTNHEPLSSK
jgi:hypothetical protein